MSLSTEWPCKPPPPAIVYIKFVWWALRGLLLDVPYVVITVLCGRLKKRVHPFKWTIWQECLIKGVKRMWTASSLEQQEITLLFKWFASIHNFFLFDLVLQEVKEEESGVKGVLISSAQTQMVEPADVMILFMHGGGFMTGHPLMWLAALRRIIASVENEGLSCRVFSLDYPLALDACYPAAAHNVVAAYRWLHAPAANKLCKAKNYILAGDSAGGNLAICGAHLIRDQLPNLPRPKGIIAISPWVDLTTTSIRRILSVEEGLEYDLLPPNKLAYCATAYVGGGDTLNLLQLPTISPVFMTDFKDWVSGYMVVLLGAVEVFAEDIQAFVTRAKTYANYPVFMHPEEGMPHDWMLIWPWMGDRCLPGLDLIATHIISLVSYARPETAAGSSSAPSQGSPAGRSTHATEEGGEARSQGAGSSSLVMSGRTSSRMRRKSE